MFYEVQQHESFVTERTSLLKSCCISISQVYQSFRSSDDHGFTPLLWSSREGQTAVFDLLLSRGARVTALNDGGDNGLHLAASKGNKEIIQRVRI